jgi:hypothetical protein
MTTSGTPTPRPERAIPDDWAPTEQGRAGFNRGDGVMRADLSDADLDRLAERLAPMLAARLAAAAASGPLLTREELANRWRVSTGTIDRMARQGMPVERVTGDAPRFNPAACDAWRRNRPAPQPSAVVQQAANGESSVEENVDMSSVRRVSGQHSRGGM